MLPPVTRRIEPREMMRKGGIVPAPRQPGAVMQDAQGAHGFDKPQLTETEIPEFRVTFQNFRELGRLAVAFTGQHHPEILHGRGHPGIIQINQVRGVMPPQDVAGMTVAVGADAARGDFGHHGIDPLQQVAGQGVVIRLVFARHEGFADQGDAVMTEALAIENRTVAEGPGRTDAVQATEQAAHDQQVVEVVKLRSVSALARVQGELEITVREQAVSIFVLQRGNHRQFVFDQLKTELVFLQNLRAAPPVGTVELDHQRIAILDADLVDPVFIAVERKGPVVADITQAFDGVHDQARGQVLEGMFCHKKVPSPG